MMQVVVAWVSVNSREPFLRPLVVVVAGNGYHRLKTVLLSNYFWREQQLNVKITNKKGAQPTK